MLYSGISGLGTHGPFQSTNLSCHQNEPTAAGINVTYTEAGSLKPICYKVKEINKLREYDAFRCRILHSQVAEFLQKCFDFRRRAPGVEIEATQYTLTSGGEILLQFESGCFKVNCQGEMTYGTIRLFPGAVSIKQ